MEAILRCGGCGGWWPQHRWQPPTLAIVAVVLTGTINITRTIPRITALYGSMLFLELTPPFTHIARVWKYLATTKYFSHLAQSSRGSLMVYYPIIYADALVVGSVTSRVLQVFYLFDRLFGSYWNESESNIKEPKKANWHLAPWLLYNDIHITGSIV